MNMSYCRFHNTKIDVDNCIEALDCYEELSGEEAEAGYDMFHNVLSWCKDNDIIQEFNEGALVNAFMERRSDD